MYPPVVRWVISLFCLSFLFVSSASAKPAVHLPLVTQSKLFDITTRQDGTLVAVGERGHILLSENGADWRQANVPTQISLMRVQFVDNQIGWAVGHEQTILKTEDGGETWVLNHFEQEVDRPLFDIQFTDPKNGFAIGAYGLMLQTRDGGQNWEKRFLEELLYPEDQEYLEELRLESEEDYELERNSILPHFNQLLIDNGSWLLVGEAGLLAHSSDSGKQWRRLEEIYMGSFFAGDLQLQKWLIAGLRGHLFSSQDRGVNWQPQHLPERVTINAILALADGYLLLGNAGHLYRIDADGKVLAHYEFDNSPTLLRAVLTDDQQLVIASSRGILTLPLSSVSGS